MKPTILDSARKHGVRDDDMLHAYRHPIRIIEQPDDVTMFIGPAHDGTLLEIGIVEAEDYDGLFLIHAMPARPKYTR